MSAELESRIGKIEGRVEAHHDAGIEMLQADKGALFSLDLLAAAALKRSMAHHKALGYLIRERNYLCAASLVRLQLDSCLRFHAAWLVDDPHAFAENVFKGTAIRKMKDRVNGVRLAYLAQGR